MADPAAAAATNNGAVPNAAPYQTNIPGVINTYATLEVIQHKKFISHLGIAFVDLKTTSHGFGKTGRTVLRKISGQFNYGTLSVIRGPRRCGKTTLLKSLAGRNNDAIDPDTQFFINEDVEPRVAYLDKEIETNILFSCTVDELLNISFKFRNPKASPLERRRVIQDVVKSFDLKEIQDLQLRYCTNEERHRAQFAAVLATIDRPNLIFFDEPLFDLDAVGIENFVNLLKRMSRHYKIGITFAVGQVLDSDILAVFDKLYVLSKGGLCLYEGSVEHLYLYLREAHVLIATSSQTPMERLIKIASKPNNYTLTLANQMSSTREDVLHMAQKFGRAAPNGIETPMQSMNWRNVRALFVRSYNHTVRMYWKSILTYLALIVTLTLVLTTAFDDNIGQPTGCYNSTGNYTIGRFVILGDRSAVDSRLLEQVKDRQIDIVEGQNLLDENVKFLFVITAALSLFQVINSVNSMNEEVKVVINEHRNGWVNINSYFLVKNIFDLIVPLMNATICAVMAYFLTAQVMDMSRFVIFLYAQLVGVLCAQSLGFAIGMISMFNNRFTSLMIIVAYLVMVVFSGYLIPMDDIQPWLQGFAHLSFMKLSYEITLLSLYGMQRCEALGYTNSYVLDEFGIDAKDAFWRNSVIILAHFLVYRFVFWTIMVSKVNKKATIDRPDTMFSGQFDRDMEKYGDEDYKNK